MQIKREVVTKVMIDDATGLQDGDTVVFIANGLCHIGIFKGITKRGCLSFEGNVKNEKVIYNIKPTSITAAEIKEHSIDE